MHRIDADYFDGKSARRLAASVTVQGDIVVVAHEGGSIEYPLDAVRVLPQLRGAPRRIEFPDGSAAISGDHAAIEAAFAVASTQTLAHRLESHLGFVFASLGGVVVAVTLGYLYGVPWVARHVAQQLPIELESQIGEAGLKSLDQLAFEPSTLEAETRAKVVAVFAELRAATDLPPSVRLEFRDGGWIGANALALPGGTVVVTDQLVRAMPGIDETAAVLAHELGHEENRHSLRYMLQDSIMALATMAIFGDVASLTAVAATAPTVLAHSGYSRDFEREADAYSFDLLRKTGRSPRAFANAMRAMEQAHYGKRPMDNVRKKLGIDEAEKAPDEKSPAENCELPTPRREHDYLSTHPAIAERIRAAEAAAEVSAPAR